MQYGRNFLQHKIGEREREGKEHKADNDIRFKCRNN